jgi:hypothetical protein
MSASFTCNAGEQCRVDSVRLPRQDYEPNGSPAKCTQRAALVCKRTHTHTHACGHAPPCAVRVDTRPIRTQMGATQDARSNPRKRIHARAIVPPPLPRLPPAATPTHAMSTSTDGCYLIRRRLHGGIEFLERVIMRPEKFEWLGYRRHRARGRADLSAATDATSLQTVYVAALKAKEANSTPFGSNAGGL